MPKVLVLMAPGFEEIETATIVDVLRRAGAEVVLAGLDGDGPCVGSRGIVFVPDAAFTPDEGDWDWVVLPGGMGGTERLRSDPRVLACLRERARRALPVAAICAAPMVLEAAGVLPAGAFTCHPGVAAKLATAGRRDELVADAGTLVTSQSAATAMDFALHLVERLHGAAKRAEVARGLGR